MARSASSGPRSRRPISKGFKGADEFELEISFAEGRKQIQHFRVIVSNDSGGNQGI
jgi:hypothetical protein